MKLLVLLMVAAVLVLQGCDLEVVETSPANYELAKKDCEAFGGLQRTRTVLFNLGFDVRLEAWCKNGTRISREMEWVKP